MHLGTVIVVRYKAGCVAVLLLWGWLDLSEKRRFNGRLGVRLEFKESGCQ